jgi:hypothetical protein
MGGATRLIDDVTFGVATRMSKFAHHRLHGINSGHHMSPSA